MEWIGRYLRNVSGAAITVQEYVADSNTFFPRNGDDQAAIAEKAAARKQVMESLRLGAGTAPIAPIIQPDFKSQDLSREEKIKRLKQLEGKQ